MTPPTPIALTNAAILTPSGWTTGSLLVRDGKIGGILPPGAALPDPVLEVPLKGRAIIPGPIDAHCHLVSYGLMRSREADLRGCAGLEELKARLLQHGRQVAGGWLLGRGFDQDRLQEGRWPSRMDLDGISPNRPLRITRVCGHAMVVNSAGLRAAGIDPETHEPGFPPGVVTEERMTGVMRAIPAPTDGEWLRAARWACKEAARVGFVGVHSLMAHAGEVRALVRLHREEPLPVRVRMQMPYAMLDSLREAGMGTGFGSEMLEIGAIKLFSDGSLGARTAALEEPYSDDGSTVGELIYPPEELAERVRRVHDAGFQVCVHAIGDRALRVTLDAIEAAADQTPWDWIPRVEHASLVNPELVRRMRQLGVGAAIQPQFARSDDWAPARLGRERAAGCYAFRTLFEAGVPLAGSTDCPVEELSAMAAIGQLVQRPAWSPDEGLSLIDTLRIFSEGGHRLAGKAAGAGALGPGQPADFVILDGHPQAVLDTPGGLLEELPVLLTVVNGAPSGPLPVT